MFILLRNVLIIKLSNEQRQIYSIYSNSKYDINRNKNTRYFMWNSIYQQEEEIVEFIINSYDQLGLEKLDLNDEIVINIIQICMN